MQPANSSAALSQLQQAQSQAQDPNTILSNQQQQLGVNAAKDTVTGLRGAINNSTKLLQSVAPSIMGRTANSLVTNAQAGRQIQNEEAPISQTLTTQGNQYDQANEDLNGLQQQAEQAASGIYQGQQDKMSYLQNLYNSLYGSEKDAADRAEQQREFDAGLSAQKAASSSSGGGSFSLPGAGLTTGSNAPKGSNLSGGRSATDADAAVRSLINTNDAGTIVGTINAIAKSASYGNTYDQAKLQLLQRYMPGWFVTAAPNGQKTVNASYIQRLGQSKALKNKL